MSSITTLKRIRGQKLATLTRVRRRGFVMMDTSGSRTQMTALLKELDEALKEVIQANEEYMARIEMNEDEMTAAMKYEEEAETECSKVREKIHAHLKSREGEALSIVSKSGAASGATIRSKSSAASVKTRTAEIEIKVLELEATQLHSRLEKEREQEEMKRQLIIQEKKDAIEAAKLKAELSKAAESDLVWERKDDFVDTVAGQQINANQTDRTQKSKMQDKQESGSHYCSNLGQTPLLRKSLPKLHLSTFSGNLEDWPAWYAMYTILVHEQAMTDVEKMAYLQSAVSGPAKAVIGNMVCDGSTYGDALQALKDRYGRKADIVQASLRSVFNCPSPRSLDAGSLERFQGAVHGATTTLKVMGYTGDLCSSENLRRVVGKLPPEIRKSWAEHSVAMENPTLLDLDSWLKIQTRILLNCEAASPSVGQPRKTMGAFATTSDQTRSPHCILCTRAHDLRQCPDFHSKSLDDRAQFAAENGCCFGCLKRGHLSRDCRSTHPCNIEGCTLKHHRLLHGSRRVKTIHPQVPVFTATAAATPSSAASSTQTGSVSEHVVASVSGQSSRGTSTVLLQVVPVRLHGRSGKYADTLALLDPGAQTSLCQENLLKKLDIQGQVQSLCLNNVESDGTEQMSQCVQLELSPLATTEDRDQRISVPEAYSVKKVNVRAPSVNNQCRMRWKHLEDLKLPDCTEGEVEILLGANVLEAVLQREARVGHRGDPVAIRTAFGWSLTGSMMGFVPDHTREVMFVHTSPHQKSDLELAECMADWWSTEAFGTQFENQHVLPPEEAKAMTILEKTTRRSDNKYEVGLLWKEENITMPDSYPMALCRLKSLEKSLEKDPIKAKAYGEVLNSYVQQGYAHKLDPQETQKKEDKGWLLPHHAVVHPQKLKPRVVFDAAAETHQTSLNSQLLKGPDLLQNLCGVILRFRQERYALVADIYQMFHQIRVRPSDQPALSYLWRDMDTSRPPDMYRMLVVIFGARCSPCIANYVLRCTLEDGQSSMAETRQKRLCRSFYMDDFLHSEETVEAARCVLEETTSLLEQGGFHLTKWRSNQEEILDGMTEVDKELVQKNLTPNKDGSEKALGCVWSPANDTFSIHVKKEDVAPTKRGVLKKAATVFDPLGIVAPFILRAKTLIQRLWFLTLDWDEELSGAELTDWKSWLEDLPRIEDISIPRCLKMSVPDHLERVELHVFSDASESAFAAVAYLRMTDEEGQHYTSLIMSRSRLAPLKQISIVRLELQGAVLATRLANTIRTEMTYHFDETTYWCDSQAVLKFIANESRMFHTFVANRVAEIRDSSEPSEWRHVPGIKNPADLCSRGTTAHQLQGSATWWHGPEFLKADKNDWPVTEVPRLQGDEAELRKAAVKSTINFIGDVTVPRLVDPAGYSSWTKFRRVVAWVRRYVWNLRSRKLATIRRSGPLTAEELQSAENFIICEDQARGKAEAPPGLSLYKDDQGVLRVKGRLSKAPLAETCQEPIILCPLSEIARLIISDLHTRVMHSGLEHTMNQLRQRFWMPKARSSVKRILRKCATCRNRRAQPVNPKMADLPKERFTMSRPFTASGLDYFGPLTVKKFRKTEKRYVLLVTCLATRAIHLEVAASMDTDAFIMALRRFISRRGCPSVIFSDNGTNLVSGEKELRQALSEWNQAQITDNLTQQGIEWRFNPPTASHMGGVWERLVGMVKRALRVVLGNQTVTDDVLYTTLTEVEYMINSRPLTYVSSDGKDPEALTPNHFLLGPMRSGAGLPPGVFGEHDLLSRKRWRHTQVLANQVWRRWMREYVPSLLARSKWNKDRDNIAVKDVVLLVSEDQPRGLWPLGVVEEVYPSGDGIVRSALVRTSGGVYKRPSNKICVLERCEDVQTPKR